jgi:hypothetical protein
VSVRLSSSSCGRVCVHVCACVCACVCVCRVPWVVLVLTRVSMVGGECRPRPPAAQSSGRVRGSMLAKIQQRGVIVSQSSHVFAAPHGTATPVNTQRGVGGVTPTLTPCPASGYSGNGGFSSVIKCARCFHWFSVSSSSICACYMRAHKRAGPASAAAPPSDDAARCASVGLSCPRHRARGTAPPHAHATHTHAHHCDDVTSPWSAASPRHAGR